MNRFIGCGKVDPTRAQFATDERATVLGWGSLEEGKSHVYNLPLPPTFGCCLSPSSVKTMRYSTPQLPFST